MRHEEKRRIAEGRGEVTSYESQPYDDAGGFAIAVVNVAGEYSGDMVGAGASRFILATETATGAVRFAGIERFSGRLGDASGSFLFENSGTLRNGVIQSRWHIIQNSATGALAGLQGHGECDPGGYRLIYWFDKEE